MGLFSSSSGSKYYKRAIAEAENTYNDQQSLLSPWTQSEQSALTRFLTESQAGGRLDPMTQFRMEDYYNSPEYQIYQEAQNAASQQAMDQMKALGAAGKYGGFGGGTFANALSQNLGQLYAQYGPQALAASRQAWENQRANAFNALYGLSQPQQTGQLAQYRGTMGQNIQSAYLQRAQAEQQESAARMQAVASFLGGGLQAGASSYAAAKTPTAAAPTAAAPSDRRAKIDIEKVAEDKRGFGWYRFKYIWDKTKEHIGVMADEIERVIPEAVIDSKPFKMVDYSLVGNPQ